MKPASRLALDLSLRIQNLDERGPKIAKKQRTHCEKLAVFDDEICREPRWLNVIVRYHEPGIALRLMPTG